MLDFRESKLLVVPTPLQVLQACTFHIGIVRDLKDPLGRGRVRVEVPTLWSTKNESWSNWIDVCHFPVGTAYRKGDCGIWWCPLPGEQIMVGFASGDLNKPFVVPGMGWSWEEKLGEEVIPLEAKHITDEDPRAGTRVRELKTEAGHTLLFNDNGKSESLFLVDWTGAGLYHDCPGKVEDYKEPENTESYYRVGECREDKTTFTQTSEKPSKLLLNGEALLGFMDLIGQGWACAASDAGGTVTLYTCGERWSVGPNIYMDAINNVIILTAGETQLVIDGKRGHIQVTRQIIKELAKPIDLSGFFKSVFDTVKKAFQKLSPGSSTTDDHGQGNPRNDKIIA